MLFPEEYLYTTKHHWLKLEGENRLKVGLTVYAEHQAGTVSFIEFPIEQTFFNKGDNLFILETIKATVEIKSPVEGKLLRCNQELENDPQLFNIDPFHYWFVELKLTNSDFVQNFMCAEEYQRFMQNL